MERDLNHFAVIEERITSDEKYRSETIPGFEKLISEQYFSRFVLTLSAVPTLFFTWITYIFQFKVIYLLLFISLYFTILFFCNESISTTAVWLQKSFYL